ncbi:MAG TPA: DUF4124 domain-containing protein [Gammaproteobacteria bacterium]|nr:DUF4124 domain-containing protein [Gammaproteobacteria bacterium]
MLKTVIISLFFFALSAAAIEARAQTVKTWVDEQGVTHYSDQAPAEDGARVKEIEVPEATVNEFESETVNERINKQLQQLEKDREAREQEAEANKKARDVEKAMERTPIVGEEKKQKKSSNRNYSGPYPKPPPGPFPEKYPRLPSLPNPVVPVNPDNQSN